MYLLMFHVIYSSSKSYFTLGFRERIKILVPHICVLQNGKPVWKLFHIGFRERLKKLIPHICVLQNGNPVWELV
jgi:hypothetical protein